MIRPDLQHLPVYTPGASIPGALKLASNESSLPPLPSVVAAMTEAAAGVNRYPDMAAVALRTALADWLSTQHNPLTIDNIATGNGSSALCLQTIQATCAAGDEVIFAWRSFEAYPILSRIAGATSVQVPLTEDYRHDLPAMAAAVTDATRLIFVCNPNNPTGTTITAAEFQRFMDAVPQHVHVVLDEAYVEYNQDADSPVALEFFARYPNLAVLRTLSKAYGLAGARVGYLVGHQDFVRAVNQVAIPFGVNAMAQAGALACLQPAAQEELLQRVAVTVAERQRVLEAASRINPAWSVRSEANFVWLPLSGPAAAELDAHLKQHGVVARLFAGEGVRVSVTTPEETSVLLAALESWQQ